MSLGLDHDEELDEVHEIDVTSFADGAPAAAGRASPGEQPQRGRGEAGASDRVSITAEDRAPLRRWAVIAVVVLLVHGAIATAVISWRKTVAPAEPPRSIVIDLVPAPGAPATPQTELPPAPEQSNAAPAKPIERVEENPEEKAAAKGEEKAKPVEEPPRAPTPVPSERAGEERGVETRAATGGGAPATVQAPRIGADPIDTRIAEPPHLRFKRATKANDWKNAIIGRPSNVIRPLKNFAGQQHRDPGTGSMARNAVGALVQNPAGAAASWGPSAPDGTKNAVGSTLAGSASNAANGTTTNAIGVPVLIQASTPGANTGQRLGAVASTGTMRPHTAINGTTMIRPGAGAGAVGGPARTVGGVINGTWIRPRYP